MPASDEGKRNLIVLEIESWRRNKLLPEQYCDFLQNIYLDDLDDRPKGFAARVVSKIGQASGKLWLLSFGIFALICFVVLHFSAFPSTLQIAIALAGTAALGVAGAKLKLRNPFRGLLVLGAGMALMLGTGFAIVQANGWMAGAGPLWVLGLCAAAWIACGLAIESALPQWFGWMAATALYAMLLAEHVPEPTIFETQIFWMPAALLFCWLSWFLHVRRPSAGTAFFAAALVLWFMPEIYSALFGYHPGWIQAEILIKIAIAGSAMFRLRKQWMEWVA
ncbi:hypothetical protein ACF3MZ_12965 [Paenibacillaceae bacterium WGS1546]|uniref:hypothetical protein n=1 Tax=Cohnella sp. WGS1546 TaxID=3366810 RepID=UPI00372CE880